MLTPPPLGLSRPVNGRAYDLAAVNPDGDVGDVLTIVADGAGKKVAAQPPAAIGSGGIGPTATHAWQPWTTVVGGVPEFVFDEDDNLMMIYGPL